MKDSLLRAHVVIKTSNLVVSHRPYTEYHKNPSYKIRAARTARLFMLF